jgi:hypothetical protein
MPRTVPLTLRNSLFAQQTSDVAVVLIEATHSLLDSPIRVSSDPTEVLSNEPRYYGTVHDGNNYMFVWMSVMVPGEEEDSSPSTQIVLEDVEHQVGDLLRSFQTPATITLTLVSASAPDFIIQQWVDLKTVQAQGNAERCTLEISREPFTSEPSPAGRFSKRFFPGMHR